MRTSSREADHSLFCKAWVSLGTQNLLSDLHWSSSHTIHNTFFDSQLLLLLPPSSLPILFLLFSFFSLIRSCKQCDMQKVLKGSQCTLKLSTVNPFYRSTYLTDWRSVCSLFSSSLCLCYDTDHSLSLLHFAFSLSAPLASLMSASPKLRLLVYLTIITIIM